MESNQKLLEEEMKTYGDIVQQDFMDTYYNLRLELPVRQNYFTGYIVANTGPLRGEEYKWYVPKEVYPNDTYPPYPAGPGYVFSADMAKKIPPTDPPPNIFNGDRIDYDLCQFNKLITVHHYAGDELRRVWTDFWTQRSGCKD
ncbi:hypothetical protein XELAEV_18019037mg [Xenopus laevis]|uniref:Hexosyltransferase n=1 Tax=Xenopus laevis TaxID=8355 RepID=A0A974HUC0_XENLA|nr:hypothetical protein XELAEV_18019037mg [Xenopus laevis]